MIKVNLERRFVEDRLLHELGRLQLAAEFHSNDVKYYQETLIDQGDEKKALILEAKERMDASEKHMKKAREDYETILERAYMQYLGKP